MTTVSREEVNALYQDLFGRDVGDAGAEYWQSQVASGSVAPENLRNALIAGAQGSDITAYSERGTRLQQQSAEQARLDAEQRAEQARLEAEERFERQQTAQQARQQALLDQIAAQQQAQADLFATYGQAAKGGRGQQQQSVFGDAAPQPTQTTQGSQTMQDIDTGSGYYRNPYASGYGMGYQDPYAGMRFLPQRGLMGPTGFGGKGGYRQPMYSPYGFSPYSGMSPAKGGYSPTTEPATGSAPANVASPDDVVVPPEPIVGADGSAPYYTDTPVVPTNTTEADPTQIIQDPAIAADGSNVVDFTPYTGNEFVRIGDQVVSRADLQRRGSDYYTRPIQAPPMRRQMYPMYGGKGGYYR